MGDAAETSDNASAREHAPMELYPSVLEVVEQNDACDWRALTLGIAALLAHHPEPRHDSLTEVAQHLRTPVNVLRAHAARLQMQATAQPRADATHEVAARIVEQADLMSGWVSAMLDVQRIRLGKLSLTLAPVDLADLVRDCIDHVVSSHDGLAIQRPAASTGATVKADPARLGQAVIDTLTSVARSVDYRQLVVQLTVRDWHAGGRRAVLQIAPATCLGTPEVSRAPCSEESDIELTLYVARQIVRLHDGDLVLEPSEGGSGSAALVILPLDFSHRSHAVLAESSPCSGAR